MPGEKEMSGETFKEQLGRLESMAEPSGTWDLSDKDKEAIGAILASHRHLLEVLINARIVLGEAGSDEHVKQLTNTELGRLWITVTKDADEAINRATRTS